MLVLRFQRTGRKNIPTYRLVVAEKSSPVKGKVQEYLGHYLPNRTPHLFEFEKERVEHWLKMGATPSDTVARLLKKNGLQSVEKFIKRYTKQKKRGAEPEVAAAPAPAAAPQEAPAEPKAEEAAKTE